MYKIKVEYRTGNSFGNHDETDYVDLGWENLDIVKENLKRITEHYEWYRDINNCSRWSPKQQVKKPEWIKEKDDEMAQYIINLKLDDGTERNYSPFWIGYFECLYSLEIVMDFKDCRIEF